MAYFKGEGSRDRGFKSGSKPVFQKKSWENDKPTIMHKATCSECGKSCEVPFRPTGEKPVYCNDCFNKKRDPSDTRKSRSEHDVRLVKTYSQKDFNDRHGARAEFHSESKTVHDDIRKILSEISTKLDQLIYTIQKMTPAKDTTLVVRVPPIKTIVKRPQQKPISKVSKRKGIVKNKNKIISK